MIQTSPTVGHALVVDIDSVPEPSGAASLSAELADHLARRAASVDVLDGAPQPPAPRRAGTAAAAPTPNPAPDQPPARSEIPTPRQACRRRWVNAQAPLPHHPDLVVGLTPGLGGAVTAARIARAAHARLVLVVQGLAAGPAVEIEGDLLREADQVAIVSECFRERALGYGVPATRVQMMPHWAHVVPSWLDRAEARAKLGWPQRAFIAVHAGPHGLSDDVDTVVRAAALLARDTFVALVDDGSHTQSLTAVSLPNLLVPPLLDTEQYALSLVAADVLVVSERADGPGLWLPSTLASYLAAGRPVVAAAASAGATSAELARTDGAGLVVPPGDAVRLAAALAAMRSDQGRRVAMGLAGIAYAQACLNRRAALARFDEIVDAALAGAPVLP